MDTRGWVLRAVDKLGWAGDKEIMRFLDEEGEALSKLELSRTLAALISEGRIEQKGDLYRVTTVHGARQAFDSLFKG